MNEKVFQSEWTRSVHELLPYAFYFKIPDPPFSRNIIRRPIYKPYDCQLLVKGRFVAMELKQHRKETAIPFSIMRDSELDGLQRAYDQSGVDGMSLIIINIRIPKSINRTFAVTIGHWKQLIAQKDRKSVPLGLFMDDHRHMEIFRRRLQCGQYVWNIIDFLNAI